MCVSVSVWYGDVFVYVYVRVCVCVNLCDEDGIVQKGQRRRLPVRLCVCACVCARELVFVCVYVGLSPRVGVDVEVRVCVCGVLEYGMTRFRSVTRMASSRIDSADACQSDSVCTHVRLRVGMCACVRVCGRVSVGVGVSVCARALCVVRNVNRFLIQDDRDPTIKHQMNGNP